MDLFRKVVSKNSEVAGLKWDRWQPHLEYISFTGHWNFYFYFFPKAPVKIMHPILQLKEADLEWKFLLVWEEKMIVFIMF